MKFSRGNATSWLKDKKLHNNIVSALQEEGGNVVFVYEDTGALLKIISLSGPGPHADGWTTVGNERLEAFYKRWGAAMLKWAEIECN